MSDTLLDNDTVTLETSLEKLFDYGFFSVRAYNVLSRTENKTVDDILNLDLKVFKQRTRNAGVKTIRELKDFQKEYSFLCLKNEIIAKHVEVLGKPYYRNDFPYLTDDEFDFVTEHWQKFGFLPASFIAIRFVEKSDNRNLLIHRMYVGLGFDRKYSIEELAKEFNLTKETMRLILRKPGVLPRGLCIRESMEKMLPNRPYVCNPAYFEDIVEQEKWPYGTGELMKLLSVMLRGCEYVQVSERTNPYLVRNELSFDNAIVRGIHNIDVAFRKNPEKAKRMDMRELTKLKHNSEDFAQSLPIFEEYISTTYGTIVNDRCDTESISPAVFDLKNQLEKIHSHKTAMLGHETSIESKDRLSRRIEKLDRMLSSIYELDESLKDYRIAYE